MATQSSTSVQSSAKLGVVILSVILPIVGYVAYFVKRDEAPEAAQSYLYSAIAGSALGILFALI